MQNPVRWSCTVAALALALAFAAPSRAETLKCQQAIAKEAAKHVQARAKLLQKCEEAVVKGKITGPCPDSATDDKIDAAEDKLRAAIGKACGGVDKECGGDQTGEDDPVTLGWPAVCPSFEGSVDPDCVTNVSSCNDLAECVECIGREAVAQAIDLSYDDLVLPSTGDLNKCQAAIGKESTKFYIAKTKALQKCQADVMKGNAHPCPDGKADGAIAKAEGKARAGICKACGGVDKTCDGNGDFLPATIGFTPSCPAVLIPGGDYCAGPVTTLGELVDCVVCVTEFKADCTDASQVPQLVPYPPECQGATPGATPTLTATPTATPTPTVTPTPTDCGNLALDPGEDCEPFTLDAACPGACAPIGLADECTCPTGTFDMATTLGADLDTGWTGISHDQGALAGKLFTANTYGCSSGGPDTLCSFVATYATPYFGAPLPLSSGSVPVCVVNEVAGPADGTLDLATGDLTYNYSLISRVYNGITNDQPCPVCIGDAVDDDVKNGVCSSDGVTPCDGDGQSALFGVTSFDCFPPSGANIGNLNIVFEEATTGTKTEATTPASPNCRAFGTTSSECFCDTCNDAAATFCRSDADCVAVGATTCGGQRCLPGSGNAGTPCASSANCTRVCAGGMNAGMPCTSGANCPGGSCPLALCGVPGQATAPNACANLVCSPAPNDEGVCNAGPSDQLCVIEFFRGCVSHADCPAPGDSCGTKLRECFTDPTSRTGTPGIASAAYAGSFCIPPTSSSAVNGVAGLPGLGTIVLPYTLTLNIP